MIDSSFSTSPDSFSIYSYICPYCGKWVPYGTPHFCWPDDVYIYTNPKNKTEKAYRILKKLIEKKIIEEPNSFKKFCELIEEISQVI